MRVLVLFCILALSQNVFADNWSLAMNEGSVVLTQTGRDYGNKIIKLALRQEGDVLLTIDTAKPSLGSLYFVPLNQLAQILQQLREMHPTIPEELIERIRNHFIPLTSSSIVTRSLLGGPGSAAAF